MPATGFGVRPRIFLDPPAKTFSQDEKRTRRRRHLPVRYGRDLGLTDEIRGVIRPVADRLTAAGLIGDVDEIAEAVRELCVTCADLLNDAKISRIDYASRSRARAALKTLTKQPVPEISRAALADGSWPDMLADMSEPLSAPLANLLGRANPSVSDAVVEALRLLDRAVLDLDRRIDRTLLFRSQNPHAPSQSERDDPEAARATLADLGVQLEDNR
ncbi:hypothetical protein GCM10027169_37230 [Gordonia jinhuaensis]|uniref:Uncharacterized protein n=1 Tax=Gordonia jinhuaensis TaxID=1517702 RepID=A0A916T2S8_9ACTN|nr:hypothetical protein [Gordonia jinhuaensis]GGB26402.1 hypothetical protein GCM10011489_13200 [Gordonia jinhuaensis]